MLKEKTSYFVATFTDYEYDNKNILKRKMHFKNLKTNDGYLLLKHWVLEDHWVLKDEVMSSKIIGSLSLGEIVRFTATISLVEFENMKFFHPHGD